MRPLSLTVEGFTCFRERQPPLDFSRLHLFAIAGPTGAGKSSILDAMMFALYGYVPRLGKAGADLITTGRDRLAVEFAFAVGERTFRVARTLRRKQSAKIVLEETTGGRVRPLSDKVAEANAAIERLVGIGYDGFSQSVVLPQGRFDTFLRGGGGDRRELLKGLLGLERYELMRRAAVERKAALEAEVGALGRRIEELAGATEDALSEKRTSLAAADEECTRCRELERGAATRLDTARARRRLTIELDDKRAELQRLDARTAPMSEASARLDASRRATPLLPHLRAAESATARLGVAQQVLEQARAREAAAGAEARRTASAAQRAAEDATVLPTLREQVDALNRIHDAVVRLDALTTRQPALDAAVTTETRQLAVKKKGLAAADARQRAAHAAVDRARGIRDAVGYNPDLHHLLEPIFSDATRAGELDARLATLRAAADTALAEFTAAGKAADAAERRARAARRRVEQHERDRERCREALDAARSTHMAAALRVHLHAGEPCPVCERRVEALPQALRTPELAGLESRLEAAQSACEAARSDCEAAERAAVAARTKAEDGSAVARLEAEIAEGGRLLAEADGRMRAAVAAASIADTDEAALRQWILAETVRLRSLRASFDGAEKAADAAEKDLRAADHDLFAAAREVERAVDSLGRAQQARDANEQERTALVEKIAAVTTAPDPDAERATLEDRITRLEQERTSTERAAYVADVEHRSAVDAMQRAGAAVEAEERACNEVRATADAALRAAGFSTDAEVRAACLSTEEESALESDIARYRQCRDRTVTRLRELDAELGGATVTESALAALEQEYQHHRNASERALERAAALRTEVERLAQDVRRAQDAHAEWERHRRTLALADVLARDLGGDRFQQYLLEDTLEQLVRGASLRLKELSGRYTLEWRDDRFHVVDHDSARERRIADTLSGGETFLASLSLALELSEQIQRSAGVVRIDSLFIDEGFGTLDADTLAVVAEAIEALQVGGRMVGIITHIEELTERLPGCVRIAKRPGQGSAWSVERSS